MECQCDNQEAGWWQGTNSVQMGTFTVVGYLLYRFSQTLPALIRWPIRLFCSLTGLTALWGWVSRLVGTLRGIQSLCKWLSRVWKFFVACSSKFKWLTGADTDPSSCSPDKPGLRLILLGPPGGGRTSLADTLVGNTDARAPRGPIKESTKRRTVIDGREVMIIDTPDFLGTSLENGTKAREALRSLQLAGPGPHALLLVIRAPGTGTGIDQDAAHAIRATLELFGDGVLRHIIPVLTHADRLGRKQSTLDKLLDEDSGGLRSALSLCEQRPELMDNRPERPQEEKREVREHLMGRVMEMATLRGHFVHEVQRREDRMREELLVDMASALAQKLGRM